MTRVVCGPRGPAEILFIEKILSRRTQHAGQICLGPSGTSAAQQLISALDGPGNEPEIHSSISGPAYLVQYPVGSSGISVHFGDGWPSCQRTLDALGITDYEAR